MTSAILSIDKKQQVYSCHNCQKSCLRGDPSIIRAVGNIYHKTCFKCDVGLFFFYIYLYKKKVIKHEVELTLFVLDLSEISFT
jgi:hypothetical protein